MHEYEAKFVIRNVTLKSFQYYELTIQNSLGTLETAILLKEGTVWPWGSKSTDTS